MKAVVDGCLALGLGMPNLGCCLHGLAFLWNDKIDQRRRTAKGCCDGPRFKVVRGVGPHEWHIDMGVHVDTAGKYVSAPGIDHLFGPVRDPLGNLHNLALLDSKVSTIGVRGGNDRSTGDLNVHVFLPPSTVYRLLSNRMMDGSKGSAPLGWPTISYGHLARSPFTSRPSQPGRFLSLREYVTVSNEHSSLMDSFCQYFLWGKGPRSTDHGSPLSPVAKGICILR